MIARLALLLTVIAAPCGARSAESASVTAAASVAPTQATSGPAAAQEKPPGSTADADELYAEPTRADRSGRILAAVYVNGHGPYRFILDTGANSSALAPRVAEQLALPPAASVQVHGVTGTAVLPAVLVESMSAGDVVLPPTVLPVLQGDIFAGADGILGVAGMQQMRIDVDFLHDRVTIGRSSGRRATSGYVTAKATLWQGGLLIVAGRVGSIPTRVIIDTGAERTIGNLPLRTAIQARSKPGDEFAATVFGATPDIESGTYFRAPTISVGPAKLVDLPVTFGDLYVFELWGLTEEPALVIGMDVLGRLERFVIDYRRQEFMMKTHGNQKVGIRRCTPSTCGSRIPESGD